MTAASILASDEGSAAEFQARAELTAQLLAGRIHLARPRHPSESLKLSTQSFEGFRLGPPQISPGPGPLAVPRQGSRPRFDPSGRWPLRATQPTR